jgi:DNA invertase Pin-like site-specific DNA recombinase
MALLKYIDDNPDKKFVVIFDDLKRYAREALAHLLLTDELDKRQARRECLNFRFEDTPEGRFFELLGAAQAELESKQHGRQVTQKMNARVSSGYWSFQAPNGYKYADAQGGGRIMVRDEPLASIVQEALKRFASGSLQTQAEVRRFLESQPAFPKCPKGKVYNSRVRRMLTQPLYAGMVKMDKWEIGLRKGNHPALISLSEYEDIQARLKGGSHAPARKDISKDFALRGFVECVECGRPMTSCYSRSKTGKHHPYYRCYNRHCSLSGKSIRREQMEGDFRHLLGTLQPSPLLFKVAKAIFEKAWAARMKSREQVLYTLEAQLDAKEKEHAKLVRRAIEIDNTAIAKGIGLELEKVEREQLILREKIAQGIEPKRSFGDVFELAMQFLSNPQGIWENGNIQMRRLVLKLTFTERMAYDREKGFLNPKKAFPFRILEEPTMQKLQVVGPEVVK